MARDYPGLKGRLMLQKSTICQVSTDSISYPSISNQDTYDSQYFNVHLQAAINYRALLRTEYFGKLDW